MAQKTLSEEAKQQWKDNILKQPKALRTPSRRMVKKPLSKIYLLIFAKMGLFLAYAWSATFENSRNTLGIWKISIIKIFHSQAS